MKEKMKKIISMLLLVCCCSVLFTVPAMAESLSDDFSVETDTCLLYTSDIRSDNSYTSGILFGQYLLKKLGNYRRPAAAGLNYQVEYILGGKNSDRENLKSVAGKLLVIRQGVNMAYLLSDSGKRIQVETLALAIASGFLIPPAAAVIEAALIFCWAFAESILDVRELFAGGHVPLIKNSSDWQLSLSNLPNILDKLDSSRKDAGNGMSYEDYLQVLLMAKEMCIRDRCGRTVRISGSR